MPWRYRRLASVHLPLLVKRQLEYNNWVESYLKSHE